MGLDLGSAAVGYMVGSSSCDDSSSSSSNGGRINLMPIVLIVLSGIITYYFCDDISSYFDISSYLGLADNDSSGGLSSVVKVIDEMMNNTIVFLMILITCTLPYIAYIKIQERRGI